MQNMQKNFALIGVAGYIAPRHLKAIKDTGNKVITALDTADSVGILDRYFDDVHFFSEFERFDRHAEKLKRLSSEKRIHYVSICSPNYLHDAHIRFAFRIGAIPICEKPLVLNPWNLDQLEELEREFGKKVYTILQLRLHPSIIALKNKIDNTPLEKKHDIDLTYITPRGRWYFTSWKGHLEKSGGIATNIGIHFFDMLIWIFGKPVNSEVHYKDNKKMSGYLELEKARVKWFLSLDKNDLPEQNKKENQESKENKPFRSIKINNEEIQFSQGFADLHTKVYENILAGKGFEIYESRPSIELVYKIRNAIPTGIKSYSHSFLLKNINVKGTKD